MDRIIVAFGNADVRAHIMKSLESSGIGVRCCASSGAEVKRLISKMDGGIIVCGHRLPDMQADALLRDLETRVLMLVVAKPEAVANWEDPNIFHLALPASSQELAATLRVLLQLQERRRRMGAFQRTSEEKAIIAQAKEMLMAKKGLTEEDAHRYVQRRSMETGMKMAEISREILQCFADG
ncbi:MAG: ANTAR domain-containing protein [Clostridiales bacterium]|nr:ANTAR domain-containing protein [Clostridiales bacterium]